VFGRFAKMFVSAQEEPKFPEFAPETPAAKPTSPQEAKLKALREQYKALPAGSPEQGALLKEAMTVLMGNMSLSDKESYFPALYKAVAPYLDATIEPDQRAVEAAGLIYEKILSPVAENFLSKWEPDGGMSISSYIISNAKNYARSNINRPGKDRFVTLPADGLAKLEQLQVPEDIINKLYSLQDTTQYGDKKQLMKAISKLLTPEEYAQYGEKIASVLKGRLVDRVQNLSPNPDDFKGDVDASTSILNITETNYDGQARENDPGQQAISSESMNLLHSLPNLSPIEKFVIDSRYFQGLTQEQTAEQLAKQNPEKGVLSKQRIQQIESKVLADLKQRLIKNFPEMGEDIPRFAKKKVFLSTAHQKAHSG
jgi:RNA polymerase sigma factor (sigma-70 family)